MTFYTSGRDGPGRPERARRGTHELVMESADMLVIASDGLLDLLGDKAVSADAFTFLSRHTDPSELCSAVSILAKERPPTDDVTVIAVCRGQ